MISCKFRKIHQLIMTKIILTLMTVRMIWVKAFKNGPSKICARQPFKNLKGYGLLDHITSNFLNVFYFTWFILEYFDPFDRRLN